MAFQNRENVPARDRRQVEQRKLDRANKAASPSKEKK